ncbi:Ccc1 family [Dimargaris cristalligena]|uniref:Ccc1 family n=1 Tax=Dimargaris cristalligena TaxID=215637 RepID=A0A4P9ZME3_9FUNG|nr:Ccc1 family [Dimargaris cristalligena]|eukprot:RKP34437.1 Ccc1 family [Dimargaris cristalligena]
MVVKMSKAGVISHTEEHSTGADFVRDAILGLSDGLTVPFALAAGLSSLDNTSLVVTAGLAELVAGAISMGLGGYLAGKSEIEHYDSERQREIQELIDVPEEEEQEIVDIFAPYGLTRPDLEPLLVRLRADPEKFVDFMMQFELKLEKPSEYRSFVSGATIGVSYFMGGLVPLLPYVFLNEAHIALGASVAVTLLALLVFGIFKARAVGQTSVVKSALQTMSIGAAAAAASYLLVFLFSSSN